MIYKLLYLVAVLFFIFLGGMNLYIRLQPKAPEGTKKFDKYSCGETIGNACFKTAIDNGVSTVGASRACGNWQTKEYMTICERILSEK